MRFDLVDLRLFVFVVEAATWAPHRLTICLRSFAALPANGFPGPWHCRISKPIVYWTRISRARSAAWHRFLPSCSRARVSVSAFGVLSYSPWLQSGMAADRINAFDHW
jgi:hypothetical protein